MAGAVFCDFAVGMEGGGGEVSVAGVEGGGEPDGVEEEAGETGVC